MQLPNLCKGCPLAATAQGYCPPQPVEAHTKLVVWGEAPGKTEGATGYGFTGASGRLLREWLRRARLSVASGWPDDMPGRKPEDVAFRNVVCCVRPGNKFPTDEEALECLRRHGHGLMDTSTEQIQTTDSPTEQTGGTHYKPLEFSTLSSSSQIPWIAYGANATRVLTGYDLPILKTRGTMLPVAATGPATTDTKWVVSSLHPAYLVHGGGRDNPNEAEGKSQDELKPLLGADARRALECGTPRIPRVSFLQTPSSAGFHAPPKDSLVSVDIEGANGRPNIVGVSWDESEAFVFPWSDEMRLWLTQLFRTNVPTFHNASFDVAELEQAGVVPPVVWYDTINMAALYEPDWPMNLQTQVLTHVPGSIAWKGLVNHEMGPNFEGKQVGVWRQLWRSCLSSLGRPAPRTGSEWYAFYNALDTAWGLSLANSLKRKLTSQGRWAYYTDVMMPLQRPLLEIGARGMPVDEAKVAEHKEECKRKVAEATAVLVRAGAEMLIAKGLDLATGIFFLEEERQMERLGGTRKFSKAKELSSLRTKAKNLATFNPDSAPQRSDLLYSWYGLPPIKNKGAKGFTTDETAVGDLLNRLARGTIKSKRGTKEELAKVLQAMIDVKRWATLDRAFLRPELK